MEENKVPESSNAEGNTKPQRKQIAPSKKWFFTFNNYEENQIVPLLTCLNRECKKYVFQEETGELGTPHLQGYIETLWKLRPKSLMLPDRIHWEKVKSQQKAIEYCQKTLTRTGRMWKFGFPPPIKTITTLYPWQTRIEELVRSEPHERKIYWFWEITGNIGKTALCKYLMVKYNNICLCSRGKYDDILYIINEFDTDNMNCVIFDIPRSDNDAISYTAMEKIKDGMIVSTKYKGKYKIFNTPHCIVFANYAPREEKLSNDRWVIEEIK